MMPVDEEAVAQALANIRSLCNVLPDSARFGAHRSRFVKEVEAGLRALGWVPLPEEPEETATAAALAEVNPTELDLIKHDDDPHFGDGDGWG